MKRRFVFTLFLAVACLLIGLAAGIFVGIKRGVPFVAEREQWTIAIYTGDSPFNFPASDNKQGPVLTAEDVTDIPAKFVADPFLVEESSTWYLFFEVYNNQTQQGDLAVATSTNTKRWQYERVILDEPFHLSYPYVFQWQDAYYLIPETFEADSIRLYKAVNFPYEWEFLETLVDGKDFVDPSIAYFNDKWWLYAATTSNDTLYLFYADDLLGPWREHPESPIVEQNNHMARSSGRVLVYEGQLYRYTMDVNPSFGTHEVWAYRVSELTTTSYTEERVGQEPIIKASGSGWNAQAMHQLDAHQIEPDRWIAAVDGFGKYLVFGFRY
jgi:hypothetical protein